MPQQAVGDLNLQICPSVNPKKFFYNDDGYRIFTDKRTIDESLLFLPVDVLSGTPITTLVYCIGDTTLLYPSEAGSFLCWRKSPALIKTPDYWEKYYRILRELVDKGIDPITVVQKRSWEKGLEFIPSYRMNDTHFSMSDARENQFTSRFWLEHYDKYTIEPGTTVGENAALDFSHEEVRDYVMGIIAEIIERYGHQGIELDFTRHYKYFPSDKQKPELLTEIVKKTRGLLKSKNPKAILIVRVAQSLRLCEEYGTDVRTWIAERLVDYVVPSSPSRIISLDIPLTEFVESAKETGVKICAGPDSMYATPELYRAAMSNYYAMGQSCTYLFNFFINDFDKYPYRGEKAYALLRDLTSADTLMGTAKHFVLDTIRNEFRYERMLTPLIQFKEFGKEYEVTLFVGDDLMQAKRGHILKQALLRLNFGGKGNDDRLNLVLNGRMVRHRSHWYGYGNYMKDYLEFDLTDEGQPLPVKGNNKIVMTFDRPADKELGYSPSDKNVIDYAPVLTSVDLFVDYDISGVVK